MCLVSKTGVLGRSPTHHDPHNNKNPTKSQTPPALARRLPLTCSVRQRSSTLSWRRSAIGLVRCTTAVGVSCLFLRPVFV